MENGWLRQYGEMVAVMVIGMVLLEPLRGAIATRGWLPGESMGSVGLSLIMATEMSIGMVLWMRVRGHGGGATLEMCAAMYASFVVVFPLRWLGAVSGEGLLLVGHLLMFGAMALLARRHAADLRRIGLTAPGSAAETP